MLCCCLPKKKNRNEILKCSNIFPLIPYAHSLTLARRFPFRSSSPFRLLFFFNSIDINQYRVKCFELLVAGVSWFHFQFTSNTNSKKNNNNNSTTAATTTIQKMRQDTLSKQIYALVPTHSFSADFRPHKMNCIFCGE